MNNFVNEYGISKEPVLDFEKRNNYAAVLKYPKDLRSGKEVHFSNEIPFLPIDDWINTEDWTKMLAEAEALEKHYVPHRTHETHSGWSSLCIHGISSVHTESPHVYGYDNNNCPWRWTDISDLCPTITNFFKNKFDYKKYFRIRIMKLSPKGFIIPHKDSISENENHIGPINIALNNPSNCNFYMDNIGILPWAKGRAIKLNLYNVHAVVNHSNYNRYHLIIHGYAGDSWEERIFNNYKHLRDS